MAEKTQAVGHLLLLVLLPCPRSGRVTRIGGLGLKIKGTTHYQLNHVLCPKGNLEEYHKEKAKDKAQAGKGQSYARSRLAVAAARPVSLLPE